MIAKAISQTQTNTEAIQKRLFFVGTAILCSLVVYYCFSINSIVFGIAQRKDAESNMHTLKSEIAEMELQYVSMQNTVTLASAGALGLAEVAHPIFIGAQKTLSLR